MTSPNPITTPLLLAIALFAYIAAAAATDRAAHEMIYPVVGWGHPLTGRKRWLVRIFAPFIVAGVVLVCAPIFLLILMAVLSYGENKRR